MAYDLKTKEKARMMWLKGISFENIAKELGTNLTTVFNWSVDGAWKDDIEVIQKELKKKSNEKVIDDIDKMNQIHLAQLASSHTLIRDARARVEEMFRKPNEYNATELRALTGALRDLTAALDTTLKNERLIRNVSTEHKTVEGNISWKDIIFESEKILNENGE
jgi:hypothetical protein